MRKLLTAAMAAITLGGAVAATATPAAARPHGYYGGGYYGGGYYGGRYYGGHHHHGDAAGAAVVAGIAGLALGAALADNGSRYSRVYYGPAYDYDYGYVYGPPRYRICEGSHWAWDPYIGRNVLVRDRYAC